MSTVQKSMFMKCASISGMVFQRPNPFAKSIYRNITFAHERVGVKDKKVLMKLWKPLKSSSPWDQVKDDLHKSALTLSGGQQQRFVSLRAISVKPDILLMDEPASALDPIADSPAGRNHVGIEEGLYHYHRDPQYAESCPC